MIFMRIILKFGIKCSRPLVQNWLQPSWALTYRPEVVVSAFKNRIFLVTHLFYRIGGGILHLRLWADPEWCEKIGNIVESWRGFGWWSNCRLFDQFLWDCGCNVSHCGYRSSLVLSFGRLWYTWRIGQVSTGYFCIHLIFFSTSFFVASHFSVFLRIYFLNFIFWGMVWGGGGGKEGGFNKCNFVRK